VFYQLRQWSWVTCVPGSISTAIGIACVIAGLAAPHG
jgi:hypothetical protein